MQFIRTIIKSYQLIYSPDDSIDRRSGCRLIAKVNDDKKKCKTNSTFQSIEVVNDNKITNDDEKIKGEIRQLSLIATHNCDCSQNLISTWSII